MDILVVDDHALMREGIALMLRRLSGSVHVWEVERAEEALSMLGTHHMDLVLLDLNLPGMDGFQALEQIVNLAPLTRVAILSALDHPVTAQRCLRAGAHGFLNKNMSMNAMLETIDRILHGEETAARDYDVNTASWLPRAESITPRQREILRLLRHGQRNKEIARELDIGEATVKVHIRNICRLLHVNNRHAAIEQAHLLGLVE